MLGAVGLQRPTQSLVPAARTASANGTAVDLSGCERAYVLITTGVVTDGTHVFKLQEADDAAFTVGNQDVAAADVEADPTRGFQPSFSTAGADDNAIAELAYLGTKRFIRVVVTASGTTTGGVYGATVIAQKPMRKNPT